VSRPAGFIRVLRSCGALHPQRRPREEAGMTSPDHRELETGPRAAAISKAMVQLLHEYSGRGPTRARTTISNDLIVCLLADTLTKSERKLVDAGEERLVLEQRSAIQRLMRD